MGMVTVEVLTIINSNYVKRNNSQEYLCRYGIEKVIMRRTCEETSRMSSTKFKEKKRLSGKGKLTGRMIDKLQNYDDIAIIKTA